MSSFAIIIPCYNEEKRLNKAAFNLFLQSHTDIRFYFVNDGSNDSTVKIIGDFFPSDKIEIINLSTNSGKGEAVRQGITHVLNSHPPKYIGYLDADLSTSLEEFYRLCIYATEKDADFIFGSRIKMLGSEIKRSFLRHIIGRLIVTLLDKKFRLGYYDTQCGAKLFKSEILHSVMNEPFSTKWFFDIELFLRLKEKNQEYVGIEYPLKNWKNIKDSKINLLSFPSVIKEIFILLSKF